ncbi:MAG: AAA family ATPase, partial [Microthrixaceae bacterium]|nr:AAA family ATPase [Microthrixaceae bacterium]
VSSAANSGAAASIERLLDQLLSGAVLIDGDWRKALEVASTNPDAIVISRDGDRFSGSGWRLGSGGSGATGAALEEARTRSEESAAKRADAKAEMDRARETVAGFRSEEQQAIRHRDATESAHKSTLQTAKRLDGDLSETEAELASLVGHVSELAQRLSRENERVAELKGVLPELEAAEAELGERAKSMAEARRQLETNSASVSALRTDLEVRSAAIEERRRFVAARLEQISERLARNIAERDAAAARRIEIGARAQATERLQHFVTARVSTIETNLMALREEQRRQSEAARSVASELDQIRQRRAAAERQLEEVRAQIQKAEVEDAETKLRLETATATVRNELDTEPETAMATECPPLPDGVSASARVRELERELRLMGPINPLALQEFTELQERQTFLQSQLDDIRATRRELTKVIRAVEAEIVTVFSAAYADVSENFTKLFETLFPGGEGKIRLTDPNNLLDTGVEIEARPSGKNVRKLSLLSGGERSLTALAYLFAVFRSRPSPFYVMDEVEAALDDVNLHRFLGLIAEFRETAQLIIVSHQKRTMEAADVLYGVTMEPGGSSKVVSERAS